MVMHPDSCALTAIFIMALARALRDISDKEDVARATAVSSLDDDGVINRDFASARRLCPALQARKDIIMLVLSKCSTER